MATGGHSFSAFIRLISKERTKNSSHIYGSIPCPKLILSLQLVNKLMNFNRVTILASMGVRDIYLKAGSNALNEKDIEPIFFSLMFKFLYSEICCDITRS